MPSNDFLSPIQFDSINPDNDDVIQDCCNRLSDYGWVLLRGFDTDLNFFSRLTSHFCSKLSFDPARESIDESTQKVDASTAAIGLHIENGNTPFPPDIVGFYSKQSAKNGSQTTLCDGVRIYAELSGELSMSALPWVRSHLPISVSIQRPSSG